MIAILDLAAVGELDTALTNVKALNTVLDSFSVLVSIKNFYTVPPIGFT